MMTSRLCCTGTGVQRRMCALSTHLLPFLSSSSLGQQRWRSSEGVRKDRGSVCAVQARSTPPLMTELEGSAHVPLTCPGCGIRLQQTHPDRPGYYRVPKKKQTAPEDMDENLWEERESLTPANQTAERRLDTTMLSEALEASLDSLTIERSEGVVEEGAEEVALICERCFSLRNYGKLKSTEAEALVPQFSVENVLKPKIAKNKGKKVVIVCVVDLFDFDSSLPVEELKSLFPATARLPDFLHFIFVGNKADLISKALSKETLKIWVRTRLKEARLPFAKRVHLISSQTMSGVQELMIDLRREIVRNTDCYIIGMQNAGKSSMLNALRRLIQTDRASPVTTASLPGTTLGFVQVPGIPVPKSCRVFDTPGLQQNTQLTSRLTMEELKLVQPRKAVKPRTYRFGKDSSLLIGGLVRLDVDGLAGQTLYATVWVSDGIFCFLGKKDQIEERLEKHRGVTLKPPMSMDPELKSAGPLVPQSITVRGNSWRASSVDVCIAGLGWVAIGCEGEAQLTLWTLKGVEVTKRPALLRDFSPVFQKPGFSDTVKSRGIRTR